jgi:hypothetical protein
MAKITDINTLKLEVEKIDSVDELQSLISNRLNKLMSSELADILSDLGLEISENDLYVKNFITRFACNKKEKLVKSLARLKKVCNEYHTGYKYVLVDHNTRLSSREVSYFDRDCDDCDDCDEYYTTDVRYLNYSIKKHIPIIIYKLNNSLLVDN